MKIKTSINQSFADWYRESSLRKSENSIQFHCTRVKILALEIISFIRKE
uniref:Uncharacterized protein n=1 Tax=Rhizophora mucronata TaxID=61149 RepID=A0A2P2IWG2_RHIMU